MPMLVEQLLPRPDAVRVEHRLVAGRPPELYAAVREADFMRAWRDSAAVRAMFAARGAAERAVAAARRRTPAVAPEPNVLRLADLTVRGDWVLLGERPPEEICFGAIGRFWAGETVWEEIDAAGFAGVDRPGLGKIAAGFSLRPYGDERTLISYECRTATTDEAARRGFMRYWRALSPFIGYVLRAQLRVVEETARGGYNAGSAPPAGPSAA
jgi:hypothetical protein